MENQFNHIMVDLETMGQGNKAAICAIAAVEFDITTGVTGRRFYEKVALESSMSCGLEVDASTILWWLDQSESAREELVRDARDLTPVLFMLSHWLAANPFPKDYQIWGNGATFDPVILSNAFQAVGYPTPWHYSQVRDVRTMLMLFPMVKDYYPFRGTRHRADVDCLYQIDLVAETYRLATSRNDVTA
jgi:hypothetical protein